MTGIRAAIPDLIVENCRSLKKHGDWDGYSVEQIHKAIAGEFNEFTDAVVNEDVSGVHGMRAELLQLANVALKGWIRLGEMG